MCTSNRNFFFTFNSEYLICSHHFWDPVSGNIFLRFRNQKYGCTERENGYFCWIDFNTAWGFTYLLLCLLFIYLLYVLLSLWRILDISEESLHLQCSNDLIKMNLSLHNIVDGFLFCSMQLVEYGLTIKASLINFVEWVWVFQLWICELSLGSCSEKRHGDCWSFLTLCLLSFYKHASDLPGLWEFSCFVLNGYLLG